MNTQQRAEAFSKFLNYIEQNPIERHHQQTTEINIEDIKQQNLPKIDPVSDLIIYHKDITSTIQKSYQNIKGVMNQMNQLKNKKINITTMMDSLTSIVEIKKLSYGLGTQPHTICKNLQVYYIIKPKVHYVDKYINKIQAQIVQIQKKYQNQFDNELTKSSSSTITDMSKILQLIRKNSQSQTKNKGDTLEQLTQFYQGLCLKEFKKIEDDLFNIPILGNGNDSSYIFFELTKSTMKVLVNLISTYNQNIVKLVQQKGLHKLIVHLFKMTCTGLLLEILRRLLKYYQIQNLNLKQKKISLKQKQYPILKLYFNEFNAIWNQIQRLRIHLINTLEQKNYVKIDELRGDLQLIVNNNEFVELNSNNIIYLQSLMRFSFNRLLKKSPFVNCVISLDTSFFKQLSNKEKILHNPSAHDFLEDIVQLVSKGIQKSLETLNLLIISAVINYVNHNLMYEDAFYAFGEMFSRNITKLPSQDAKPYQAITLVLNCAESFPAALKNLSDLKIPEELNSQRVKTQTQQIVANNEQKTHEFINELLSRVISSEWFRYELQQDYEIILRHWLHLQPSIFHLFIQKICKLHCSIIIETKFSHKHDLTSAMNLQKQVRGIISFYEKHSHSISPWFKKVFDFIQILMLESEEDLKKVRKRYEKDYGQATVKKIWLLKN